MRIGIEFCVEFFGRDTDFVQIAAIAKLDSTRHHMDVEAIHVVICNIGGRIADHGELVGSIVTAVLLLMHIVGFLRANDAEVTRDRKHQAWIVDVNMNFRLAFGSSEHE